MLRLPTPCRKILTTPAKKFLHSAFIQMLKIPHIRCNRALLRVAPLLPYRLFTVSAKLDLKLSETVESHDDEKERTMKKFIMVIAVLILSQGLALGQTSGERKGWGYIFGGVGGRDGVGSNAVVNVGGGGEGIIAGGFGVGGELGYLASTRDTSNGFGLGSVNLSYHFNRAQKLVPFVTGGGSVGFRGGATGGGNIGGGVHYWMSDNVGLRLEVRDFIFSSDSPNTVVFRVGLSFH
jgi:hypothetical protein